MDVMRWALRWLVGVCLALSGCGLRFPPHSVAAAIQYCSFGTADYNYRYCDAALPGLDASDLRKLRSTLAGEKVLYDDAESDRMAARRVALEKPPSVAMQRAMLEHYDTTKYIFAPVTEAALCRRGCDVLRRGLEKLLAASLASSPGPDKLETTAYGRGALAAAMALGFIGDARSENVLVSALTQKRSWRLTLVAERAIEKLAIPAAEVRKDMSLVAAHWSGWVRAEARRISRDEDYAGYRRITLLVTSDGDWVDLSLTEPLIPRDETTADPPYEMTDVSCVAATPSELQAHVLAGPEHTPVFIRHPVKFKSKAFFATAETGHWQLERNGIVRRIGSHPDPAFKLPGMPIAAEVLDDGTLVVLASGGIVSVDARGVHGVLCAPPTQEPGHARR